MAMTPPVISIPTERVYVDENDVHKLLLAREDTVLDSSTIRDGLIRVDALGRLLAAEVFLQELLIFRDTRRTTNEDDLVDLVLLDAGIPENLLDRLHGFAKEVHVELLEADADERLREIITTLENSISRRVDC